MTEKKVIETQYGWYQKNDDKVNVDEIIGIIKTDEQTNSVQLKKEAQLSICEKKVLELEKENEQLKHQNDNLVNMIARVQYRADLIKEDNEQLKKGMIGVVDRYIKNVDCNPPSSARIYIKIKEALMNIREDLRDLMEEI